jgi:arginyl-tRNA synthetase
VLALLQAFKAMACPVFATQRTQNYVFTYEKCLNLKGNTAVFLLYAVARLSVRNLLRRRRALCLCAPHSYGWPVA